jgi:hypothetical protein
MSKREGLATLEKPKILSHSCDTCKTAITAYEYTDNTGGLCLNCFYTIMVKKFDEFNYCPPNEQKSSSKRQIEEEIK